MTLRISSNQRGATGSWGAVGSYHGPDGPEGHATERSTDWPPTATSQPSRRSTRRLPHQMDRSVARLRRPFGLRRIPWLAGPAPQVL